MFLEVGIFNNASQAPCSLMVEKRAKKVSKMDENIQA